MKSDLIEVIKIIVFSSVLFVWVIRYDNIVEEFRFYKYPDWMRDLVGIMKISFVVMLLQKDNQLVMIGASGIVVLMFAAIITHLKVKNPLAKMLPSMGLFSFCLIILFGSY